MVTDDSLPMVACVLLVLWTFAATLPRRWLSWLRRQRPKRNRTVPHGT